jgi:hypothetical protein
MTGSVAAVVCLGFGPAGSAGLAVTLGFGTGGAAPATGGVATSATLTYEHLTTGTLTLS